MISNKINVNPALPVLLHVRVLLGIGGSFDARRDVAVGVEKQAGMPGEDHAVDGVEVRKRARSVGGTSERCFAVRERSCQRPEANTHSSYRTGQK